MFVAVASVRNACCLLSSSVELGGGGGLGCVVFVKSTDVTIHAPCTCLSVCISKLNYDSYCDKLSIKTFE